MSCLPSAAALWVLLGSDLGLTVRNIAQTILEPTEREVDIEGLLKRLLGAWPTSGIAEKLPHPEVLLGLEQYVLDFGRPVARRIAKSLLLGLLQKKDQELLQKVIRRELWDQGFVPDEVASSLLADELAALLTKADEDDWHSQIAFEQSLTRLANWPGQPSQTEPVFLFVRALLSLRPARTRELGKKTDAFFYDFDMPGWVQPSWSPAEWKAVAQSIDAKQVASRFVRAGIPGWGMYHQGDEGFSGLCAMFVRLDWDFTADFLHFARTLGRGHSEFADKAVAVALNGQDPPYDEFINRGLEARKSAEFEENDSLLEAARKQDQLEEDPVSPDYFDRSSDDYGQWDSHLDAVIAARRRREGYAWILIHPKQDELLSSWAEAILSDSDASDAEVSTIIKHWPKDRQQSLWQFIGKLQRSEYSDVLADGLRDAQSEYLDRCIDAIIKLCPSSNKWPSVLIMKTTRLPFVRRAEIATVHARALGRAYDSIPRHSEGFEYKSYPEGLLNTSEQEAIDTILNNSSGPISEAATEALRLLVDQAPMPLVMDAVRALERLGSPVVIYVPKLLACSDYRNREYAYQLSAKAPGSAAQAVMRSGLSDPDYRCRVVAMEGLGEHCQEGDKDQAAVLGMVMDVSAGVRKACAALIGRRGWHSGQSHLMMLLRDAYNSRAEEYDEQPVYSVARAAAQAFNDKAMAPLPTELINELISQVRNWENPTLDPEVVRPLLSLLSKVSPPGISELLISNLKYPEFRRTSLLGLIGQLRGSEPEFRKLLPPAALLALAEGTDSLAGAMALVLLGALGASVAPDVYTFFQGAPFSDSELRVLCVGLGSVLVGADVPRVVRDILPKDHPGLMVLDQAKLGLGTERFQKWIKTNKQASDWVENAQSVAAKNQLVAMLLAFLGKANGGPLS